MQDKQNKLLVFIYTASFIAFISTLYLIWHSYSIGNNILLLLGIIALTFLILSSLYSVYSITKALKKAEETNDIKIAKYITGRHILCHDPLCPRCRGWWTSFLIVFGSIFTNPSLWVSIAVRFGQTTTFLIGFILMLLSVPAHGTLTRLYEKHTHPFLKFFMGCVFGISLALISGSVILWLGLTPL